MAMLKIEQDRVKNLLIDTVTLLCKNSLQYNQELCVEGLLGVKVDQKDVFFVHISETFPSNIPLTQGGNSPTAAQTPKSVGKQNNSKNSNHKGRGRQRPDDNHHIIIAPETTGHRPVEVVAGSRRSGTKRDSSSRQDLTINNNNSEIYTHSGQSELTEPEAKRSLVKYESEEGSGSVLDTSRPNEIHQNPWPSLAASMGQNFGTLVAHVTQNPLEGGPDVGSGQQSETDPTQPGCSTWPLTAGMMGTSGQEMMLVPADPSVAIGASPTKSPRNQKDFPCDVCGKVFHMSHHLRQHMRTHTGERPYRCDVCGVYFTQISSLHRHQRAQHKTVTNTTTDSPSTPQQDSTPTTPPTQTPTLARHHPDTSSANKLEHVPVFQQDPNSQYVELNTNDGSKAITALSAEQTLGDLVEQARSEYFSRSVEMNKPVRPQYVCGDCNLEFDMHTHFENHVKTFHDTGASHLDKNAPLS